tara:strand:- start:213 stop:614 length:402 start_codon:yes stop_codon:yes gene_type:complete
MIKNRIFFIIYLIACPFEVYTSNHSENLSCFHMENDNRIDNYWRIDSGQEVVSYWNETQNLIENYKVTKLDNKTVAWNQMKTELTVFVLDKYTMRQSGTIISSTMEGKSEIKKRWFADCVFLSNEEFRDKTGN